MINLIILTILKLFFFLFLSVFVFYLPGLAVLGKKDRGLKAYEQVSISFAIGIILFVLMAVLLGILKLRFLSLLVFVILFILVFRRFRLVDILLPLKRILENKILVIILFLGIIVQGLINFPSGFWYQKGIYFWSSQGHDGLWHVSLMKEIKNHFPPQNPLYAGAFLQNYHYVSDILMGEFYRIFSFFNSLDLYFRFFPVLLSFLIGISVFSFASRRWSRRVGYWSMFFTYFCGSFGYIVSILKGQFPLSGETTFWASQGNTILGNPPQALGVILLTNFFLVLQLWFEKKNNFYLFLGFLLAFGLSIVKVSIGAVLVAGMLFLGLVYFLIEKKANLIFLSSFLALSNFLLLKLISPHAESLLIFEPLWFTRTMMVAKLGLVEWELRRQHYISVNLLKGWLRVIQLELEAIVIFIVGNSGMRLIGIWGVLKQVKTKTKIKKYIDVLLVFSMLIALIPLFIFVQKGIIYNLIQFMQTYFHIFGIYAGLTAVLMIKKMKTKLLKGFIAFLVIILAAPTALGNLFDFYGPGKVPLAKITYLEIEGLDWLRFNSSQDSIILTKPFNKYASDRYSTQPWPIAAWYSTSYVFVFSERYTYISGEEQLNITGYKIEEDLNLAKKFFTQKDFSFNKGFLKEKGIDFIYLRRDEIDEIKKEENNLGLVFENDEVLIYRVISNDV